MEEPVSQKQSRFTHALKHTHKLLRENKIYDRVLPAAFFVGVLCALLYYSFLSPPKNLPVPAVITIKSNETLQQVAEQLQSEHAVRSSLLFELLVRLLGGNTSVRAGSYFFAAPQNLFAVALRFRNGDFQLNPVRVTIVEGTTVRQIADMLSQKLAPFDEAQFLEAASSSEGKLYPDTYFFYPDQDPQAIEGAMQRNFQDHITLASTTLAKSGHSLQDLLIMASILVGEASTDQDRRLVAGILWKRISLGIPLEVDAPFGYVLNKKLTDLTLQDLQIDSPYNTYLHKGLPPTPIGNPAIEAIIAAATPIKTSYLYYLSDTNGTMHYSATFAEHEAQIVEYLK